MREPGSDSCVMRVGSRVPNPPGKGGTSNRPSTSKRSPTPIGCAGPRPSSTTRKTERTRPMTVSTPRSSSMNQLPVEGSRLTTVPRTVMRSEPVVCAGDGPVDAASATKIKSASRLGSFIRSLYPFRSLHHRDSGATTLSEAGTKPGTARRAGWVGLRHTWRRAKDSNRRRACARANSTGPRYLRLRLIGERRQSRASRRAHRCGRTV